MQNTYIIYKFLTMKILKISTITVAVLVAVFIIIACIFPPIAKNYINKHSKELIGRQINIKGLYINIFTGYARITDFQLLEANDLDTFVSFDTLSVDMSLHRLLANEVRINHISLTNPSVKVLQQGSEFNFDDLLALGSTDPPIVLLPSRWLLLLYNRRPPTAFLRPLRPQLRQIPLPLPSIISAYREVISFTKI